MVLQHLRRWARPSLLRPLLAARGHATAAKADVVIVGAGHNGLVAAALLARQGLKVGRHFINNATNGPRARLAR